MIYISDINDPRISLYRNLRFTPASHSNQNLFISEGEKVTLKLFKSNFPLHSVFALQDYYDKYYEIISSRIDQDHCYFADKDLMNQIVGYRLHTGIMAIASQTESVPLNQLCSPLVILNNIINSENVGSIIRNSCAFGINSIVTDLSTAHPFMRRSVRVSMGTVFDIKHFRSANLEETILNLKSIGFRICSAELSDNSLSVFRYQFPSKFALIFGSEGNGIDPALLVLSDDIIEIPISPSVPSINVAAASAVFFGQISLSQKNS